MTNTQIPSYSGVTINISNPTVTTMPSQNSCQTAPIYNPQYANGVNVPAQPAQSQPVENIDNTMQALPQPQVEIANSVNQSPQNQLPQAYPASYYMNNYNYTGANDAKKTSSIAVPPENIPEVQVDATVKPAEEDMSSSTDIINELDARVAKEKELEENGKQTKVVALTDEYIMSLENYLNNQNTDIRLMASKEILTRLDEDKTRYDDAALNALLNKMLQDPQKLIRIAALSAFSSGLASGNDYTVQLLNNIQQNPNSDKEDVVEAANILLKMSADTEIKYIPTQNNIPIQEEQKAE